MITRRRLLSLMGAGGAFERLGLMNALAQGGSSYKALVCVFLYGGNDGNNTIVPISTPLQNYTQYAAGRAGLALSQAALLPIGAQGGATYGLHPRLAEIKNLYALNKAAFIANAGPLVKALTKMEYQSKSKPAPDNLFSHSDQQDQWQTAVPNNLMNSGWAGRAADAIAPLNGGSQFPTVLSVTGANLFGEGQVSHQTTVTPGSAPGLSGFGYGMQTKLTGFQQLLQFDNGLALVQASNNITTRANSEANLLAAAMNAAPALQTAFPASNLGAQLKQVAKVMQVRAALGLQRQIFFASLGGFDTHGGQLALQDTLLQDLSQSLSAFYNATVELGVDSQVTTFTESEFGRTLQPSSGGGSDHAWGNHQMVLGGAVHGGDIYGKFPTLAAGGPDDANGRGVWIPTTSVDQYGATLASWFGVPAASLPAVFPNLGNFATQNLGFV